MSGFELPDEFRVLLNNELQRRGLLTVAARRSTDLHAAAKWARLVALTLSFAANVAATVVGDAATPLTK